MVVAGDSPGIADSFKDIGAAVLIFVFYSRHLAALLQSALEAGRTLGYYTDLSNQVEALTPEAVHAAFRKYIDPANLVIIRAGDFKK